MERAVGQALRVAGLVCLALVAFQAVIPQTIADLHSRSPLAPGMVLVSLHFAVMALVFLRRWSSRAWLWASFAPLALGFLVLLPHRSLVVPINYWAPGYWAMPWVISTLLVLRRRTYLVLAVVLPTLATVLDLVVQLAVHAPVTRWTLEPVPGYFTSVLLPAWLCDALLGLGRSRDEAQLAREQAEQRHAAEVFASDNRREAARLVHDHLLHALHAVARTDGVLSAQQASDECEAAYVALTNHHAQQSTGTALRDLLAADPALAAAGATLDGDCPPMPAPATRAIADAAHEALNNVARHARAAHCSVRLDHDGDQWTCTLVDDGQGFDPSRLPTNRMGVRHSIVDRLAAVGGSATIDSVPGRGTTVTLSWPAAPVTDSLAPDDDLAAHNATARAAWPSLLFAPAFTALLWPFVHPVWPVVLACTALVVVGGFHIVRLRHHPLTIWDTASLMGTSLGAWAVNLWCAPPVVHSVHPLWLAWGAAGLAHLVVLQTRWRRGLVALATWLSAMVALWVIRSGGRIDWNTNAAVLTVGLSDAVGALVVFHQARRYTRESLRQRRLAEAVRQQAQRVDVRSQLEQYWSQRVTSEAIPLLRRLADDPSAIDDDVRRQAVLLEATVRDELVLGPGNVILLDALRQLRDGGWAVFSSIGPDDHDVAAATAALATGLGRAARPAQPLTLSQASSQVAGVVIDPSPEQVARWRRAFDHMVCDPDFCRVAQPVARQVSPRDALAATA